MTDVRASHRSVSSSPAPPTPRKPSWGWFRWAWHNLTSMKTAVVLLALLALAAIPGSLLPQRNVATDPAAVPQYAQEHPTLAPWLDRFGLFDVYASPWFAAIYLLLLASMTGCVLPRSWRLWKSVRSAPPAAPRNLGRLDHQQAWRTTIAPATVVAVGAAHLRGAGFRVRTTPQEVRAERGYLRELGNLAFHLSLLVLLIGVAAGRLIGFEGRVVLAEGATFANDLSQYDAFAPSVWTDVDDLEPMSFRLDQFEVAYQSGGPNFGQPTSFTATVAYRSVGDGEERTAIVEPNHPLDVNETKVFLTGNGYAPVVTVRDGRGKVAFTGPVVFLPLDANNTSEGVVKVPDAKPTQLAFEGLFLPTADVGPQGPYSMFPDALDPQLLLTAYTGDLGLGDGVPQSVFALDKDELTEVQRQGKPFRQAMSIGETMSLPGGQGSLTFDGVSRFANFQIAYDPGKEITLAAAIILLIGLTTSLSISRRRVWVRVGATDREGNHLVEVAGYSLSRREPPTQEIDDLVTALRTGDPTDDHSKEDLA